MAWDAAERVCDALVEAGLPVRHLFPKGETSGWEFEPGRPVVGVSRRGLRRLRVAMLHIASMGWVSEDEIFLTFRALVRRESLATFSAAYAPSQRGGRQRRCLWCPSFVNFGWQ